ncbi:MAG: proprotein convertase P-domain-containing protein [Saprospiraceae bacterium]|nr:proprotein convertase P-domain-containing protein [Saprospiraceae bacterium]
MRTFFAVLLLLSGALTLHSQTWTEVSERDIEITATRDIFPETYRLYALDNEAMRLLLWSAPHEKDTDVHSSKVQIEIMMAGGISDLFRIVQYDMMEPELAARFPDIRTFYGVSTTDPYRYVRIDYTEQGFRAVIRDIGYQVFIDHFQRGDKTHRIVYYRHDYKKTPKWGCLVSGDDRNAREHDHGQRGVLIGDCQLRSYRLAQATTGEYSNYHGATSPAQEGVVMSAVVNIINRVNQVYEAEVAVRMILVNNTNTLFYYNPATDPFTGNDAGIMLDQNITNTNNVIGSANYDIGHVFGGTGNNGVAYLAGVCNTTLKAGGVTTSTAPVGDPFSIDYVAHEMGHQFGGQHTFYNSCNNNRSNASAMEPGSGSTIMAYAGICTPNVQSNSDAYFHARSLEQIKNFIAGNGNACAQIVPSFVNTAPVVTPQSNYSIPVSTPFILTLSATDAENHPLTFAWEQMNAFSTPAQTMPPATTNTTGPMFRSIFATSSPSRYFPPLANVIANTTNTWQVLPSVARSMSFRGVARDFTGVAGCNHETNITVSTVNAAAGAFSVTSFNAASVWVEGESRTITWNVANTNVAPVNAPNVDILLSYDGGNTYPTVLLSGTPNDGSESIIVPAGTTNQGRIMVRGTNHIFYDINNANITIQPGFPNFDMTLNPSSESLCSGQSKQIQVNTQSILGYNTPINLSITGLPAGVTHTFSPNPVNPGSISVLTLTNVSAASGNYAPVVQGVSGTLSQNRNLTLTVPVAITSAPALSAPADNAVDIFKLPSFSWSAVSGATSYEIQVSTMIDFSSPVISTSVASTAFTPSSALQSYTLYYWRVRGINACGTGVWSPIRNFRTQVCVTYSSTNVPINIPASGTPSVNSVLTISDRGVLTDLDVLNLTGLHTWVNDLRFKLIAPNNASQLFWDRPCGSEDNFNINFDQDAPAGTWPCPPVDGGFYRPNNSLNIFNNLSLKGTWTLNVRDTVNLDGGSLQSWSLGVCMTSFCRLTVDNNLADGPGSLFAAVQCANSGDTIRFATNFTNQTINLGNQNLVINKALLIEANPSANIHVISSSADPTVVNNNLVTIRGLNIHASGPVNGAILNTNKLVLENVNVYNYPGGSSQGTVRNNGNMEILGNCNIQN